MINKLECTCIEAYTTRNMRDPNCCACSCDHNDLVEQLAKANERVAELESMQAYSEETGFIDLNKFAIEKKIEALRKFEPISNAVANHWCDKEQKGYLWLHAEILAEIEKLEQLRKEQE